MSNVTEMLGKLQKVVDELPGEILRLTQARHLNITLKEIQLKSMRALLVMTGTTVDGKETVREIEIRYEGYIVENDFCLYAEPHKGLKLDAKYAYYGPISQEVNQAARHIVELFFGHKLA